MKIKVWNSLQYLFLKLATKIEKLMKTSLDHLPEIKQEELQDIVEILLEKTGKKAEIIILFGSHARGDWVEDRYTGEDGIVYEYKSDFDILVVTATNNSAQKWTYWSKVEKKLQRNKLLRTWVNLVVVGVQALNDELRKKRYFYRDIQEEGIMLFDSKRFELAEPIELTEEERKEEAELHFKKWFSSAKDFFRYYEVGLEENRYYTAAFNLHQATERLFTTILLVFTGYKPKLHDLEKLNKMVINQERSFLTVFPQATEEEKQNFLLLKRAYIDSRYDMDNFDITREQLEWLAERVNKLKELTQRKCQEKIGSFIH